MTLSPASPAAYRYDGDLASDTRFLSQEDAMTEPVDTLAGPLTYTFQRPIVTVLEEASKQLEHITMWVVSWIWFFGLLFLPACSFSPFVCPSSLVGRVRQSLIGKTFALWPFGKSVFCVSRGERVTIVIA